MSFTMPTQKRLIDTNLFPKKPGYDYRARAGEAWQAITENRAAAAGVVNRIEELDARIMDGEEWLTQNQMHERYMEGYQKLNELHRDLAGLHINLASLRKVIWFACCVLYACLHHSDREGWITQHGVGFDGTTPEGIWDALYPGEEPPGSYPEGKDEKRVERSANYSGWTLKEES